jgi:serpin B
MKKTLLHSALCAMSLALPAFADEAADLKAAPSEMNRQGFKLFETVCKADAEKNMFLSPYSIDGAFGMVYCGAKGTTAEEIRKTLGLPADPATCGAFFDTLTKQYAEAEKTEILVSNSVWTDTKQNVLPAFMEMIEKHYGGAFYKEDFKQSAKVSAKINSYVEAHTKNMIKDLLTPDFFSADTSMVLLNTLYFEAKWANPFPKDDTKPMAFNMFGGKEKEVQMMYQKSSSIAYYAAPQDNVHAIVLPYENRRFELVALMPFREGTDHGEADLNKMVASIGEKLDSWLGRRVRGETRVWLPKTDLTCKLDLGETLQKLGMKTPFSNQADFSGIDTEEALKIENVVHKTALKMDEVSTKAAAATAIGMARITSIGMPDPVNEFRADRPFLALIRDNQTGLILFMGRINDPGSAK